MIENIFIEKSSKSPAMNFDADNGIIDISGRSVIVNSKYFYEPIINDWLEKYISNPKDTVINIALDYYNTSSSMWIYQLLKKLSQISVHEKKLTINWFYSDDDIKEAGEDFEILLETKFNIIKMINGSS
jgi:hypothetical protein